MGVIVVPWRKGSRTRLYVKEGDNNQTIGWVDTESHIGELVVLERATEFVAALYRYKIPREVSINIVANSKPTENVDLARNLPGAAAFKKAEELTQGMNKFHADIVRSIGYGSVEQTWIQGAEGEQLVGNALQNNLPKGWHILHSVPIGSENSDIDHLVIGPNGVFSINTKNHPGSRIVCAENRVKVQGKSMSKNQPYARNSRFEANRAGRALSEACGFRVHVQGVIAYIALEVDIMSNPKDGKVTHLNADHLTSWLLKQNQVLSPKAVEVIYDKARWSRTWNVGSK